MKSQVFYVGSLFLIILSICGCTDRRILKNRAEQEVQSRLSAELTIEAKAAFPAKTEMIPRYAELVGKRSETEVKDVVIVEGAARDSARVTVEFTEEPFKIREALVQIIATHAPEKDRNLNIQDAIILIRQQQGVGADTMDRRTMTIEFTKNKQGSSDWVVSGAQR